MHGVINSQPQSTPVLFQFPTVSTLSSLPVGLLGRLAGCETAVPPQDWRASLTSVRTIAKKRHCGNCWWRQLWVGQLIFGLGLCVGRVGRVGLVGLHPMAFHLSLCVGLGCGRRDSPRCTPRASPGACLPLFVTLFLASRRSEANNIIIAEWEAVCF